MRVGYAAEPEAQGLAAVGDDADGVGGEGAQEGPEGGYGGSDDANVDFNVGPDAGGNVGPYYVIRNVRQ